MHQDPYPSASNFVPETLFAGGHQALTMQPQARFYFEFYNGLGEDVVVITRTGVRYTVPRMPSSTFRGFVIRTRYGWGYGVKVDTYELLNDQGKTTSQEAQLLDQQLTRDDGRARIRRVGGEEGSLDYLISQSELERYGGAVYVENLDLTVSVHDAAYALSHPYSLSGMRKRVAQEATPVEGSSLTYQLRIVDRLGRYGDRYVNLGGEIFLVRAERNTEGLLDGVYAVTDIPATGQVVHPKQVKSVYYSFEEADKTLPVYSTYNEAKTLGNPQDVYKRELEERSHQLKLDDLEFKERKASWERDSDERKRTFEIEQHNARMKMADREDQLRQREFAISLQEQDYKTREGLMKRDQLVLKDVLERRSLERKDTQEVIKSIPLYVTGIGAIALAIKKLLA